MWKGTAGVSKSYGGEEGDREEKRNKIYKAINSARHGVSVGDISVKLVFTTLMARRRKRIVAQPGTGSHR
jgi:hypothetical protein